MEGMEVCGLWRVWSCSYHTVRDNFDNFIALSIPREDNDCWRQYLIADNIIFSSTNEAKAYRCVSILQSIDRFMGFCVTKPLGVKSGRPACPASQQTLLSALGWGSAISLPVQTPRPAHCTTHTNCKDSRSTATEPGLQG